jgi:hypothetical protein
MESTEKKPQGKNVVIRILLLATVGAALTWMRYTVQVPSTRNARLVSDRTVIASLSARRATFAKEAKPLLPSRAQRAKNCHAPCNLCKQGIPKTMAVIILKEVPRDANLQTRCDVTVDTSVNSKSLKID